MKEVICIAIRGRPVRTTEQQNNRTTEQQIELGSSKFMNCLTTVSKDGMLLIKETKIDEKRGDRESKKLSESDFG